MKKHDVLIIRACKAKDPKRRLRTLYRRLYGNFDNSLADSVMLNNLARIVSEHNLMDVKKLCDNIFMDNYYTDLSCKDRIFKTLYNHIRFMPVSEIEGYIVPARWRNKK